MKKRTMARLTSVLLVMVLMLCSTSVTAFAASKNDPYGFVWLDEATDKWNVQYYEYNSSEKAYNPVDYVTLDGDCLYDKNGVLIYNSVKEMDDDQSEASKPTVCFRSGTLYFITEDGKVCAMSGSTAKTYSVNSSIKNAKNFELDRNDIGVKVSGKNLSSLTFSGSYARDNSTSTTPGGESEKSGNYVLTYAYGGDPTKIAYDAYRNDKLLISVFCKNSNVWVETEKKLISDTCVGAKFVGYSHDFFTILYDLDGTVYAFANDNFEKALPISLGEEILSYEKDKNGFVESITTTRTTYNLDELLSAYGYDDLLDMSYVKNTTSKSVAYSTDGDVLLTLKKSGNYLYWNGEKLASSYKSTYLGIAENGCPVWINSNSKLYYFNGIEVKELASKVTLIRYNSDGFAYQYKIGSKVYDLKF